MIELIRKFDPRAQFSSKVASFSAVHVLGLGNLGRFFAHSLRKAHPDLPITLLFHRQSLVQEWDASSRGIEIATNGVSNRQEGFDFEVIGSDVTSKESGNDLISNLIVATKTYATKSALSRIAHRIDQQSSLLFVQNGMGSIEEAQSFFARETVSPSFFAGITNHGLYSTGQFSSVHAGIANTIIGAASINTPKNNKLVDLLLSSPVLDASQVPPSELLKIQLRKLAVNAVINPLTVLFDCPNGELFDHPDREPLLRAMTDEISAVTIAILQSQDADADIEDFKSTKLFDIVCDIGAKTAKNVSSMRQDSLAGRRTEIDYINGYIVAKARAFGLPCPIDVKVVQMVLHNARMTNIDITSTFSLSSR